MALAVVLLLGAGAVGCTGDTSSDGAPRSSSGASASSTKSEVDTPTAVPSITAVAVSDQLRTALAADGKATVRIQVGTSFTLDGTAGFGDAPWSLDGHIDFRESEADSGYVARDLKIRVDVPPGVEFPDATTATEVNPWGPALARIDPGVVMAATRDHGTGVTRIPAAEGGTKYIVTLNGPEALDDFGYDPSPEMPDTITYDIVVDSGGRPVLIHADFDDYGADLVSFDWK